MGPRCVRHLQGTQEEPAVRDPVTAHFFSFKGYTPPTRMRPPSYDAGDEPTRVYPVYENKPQHLRDMIFFVGYGTTSSSIRQRYKDRGE